MKTSVNLMTDQARRDQLLRDARHFWGRVLLLTGGVLVLVGSVEWWQGRTTSARLRALEARYEPVQALQNDCARMEKQIQSMRSAQQLTLRLVDTRPTVTLLGALSAAAAATDGQVYVRQLELAQPRGDGEQRIAAVSGIGIDNAAIATFTDALRTSRLFTDVMLSSSDRNQVEEANARSFRIECKL